MLACNHLIGFGSGSSAPPLNFVSSDNAATSGVYTSVGLTPSSAVAGDLLVFAVLITTTTTDIFDLRSGWTSRFNSGLMTSGRLLIATATYTPALDVSVGLLSGGSNYSAVLGVYRGAEFDTVGTSNTSMTASAITTGLPGCSVLGFFGSRITANFSEDATPPSGFTERADARQKTTAGYGTWDALEFCDKTFAAAGSTGSQTAGVTFGGGNTGSVLLSLKQAS